MSSSGGNARRSGPRAELRVGDFARFDLGRPARTGVPEVILAEGKRAEDVVAILRALQRAGRGAVVSRVGPELERALTAARGLRVRFDGRSHVAVLAGPLLPSSTGKGVVALLTAGTADIPVAEEARTLLEAAGARVAARYDVGVAGLHRLERTIAELEPLRPRLYLVFAGREGALPTVVAGLVRAPVIGVPTSQGYGRGGRGEAALNAMLQSCAALAVVNIDGGVPAALFALQMLGNPPNGHRSPPRAVPPAPPQRRRGRSRTL